MITRPGLLLLLTLLLWLGASAASAGVQVPSVEIQVPGVSQPVRLAPADADAFQRRLAAPPPYIGPIPTGDSFVVTSAYWDIVLGSGVSAPPVEAAATYFPMGGIVRAPQANRDAHFVLDLRQRAMLDRYIRVAREGSLSSTPGALQVLAAASLTETIGVEVAGKPFEADGRGFWSALRSGNPPAVFNDPPKPPVAATGYWFVVTAPEGRAITYFNDTAQQSLTDALGTETYDARSLATIGVLPPPPAEPPRIVQQEPQGSLLWWPVMFGSGAALLAAAVWLRRRYP